MSLELHNYIKLALVLAGQRIDEVALAKDSEFNLIEHTFEIPVERIKVTERGAHIVPISDFGLEVFKEIRKYRNQNDSIIADGTRYNKSRCGSLRWWFAKNPHTAISGAPAKPRDKSRGSH
jgi:integrase